MKCFYIISLLCYGTAVQGQALNNLVINGELELLVNDSCVRTANHSLGEFIGWFDIGVQTRTFDGGLSRTSPDSYHRDTCGSHNVWNNSTPLNSFGYQMPLSGFGYGGFIFHRAREFVSGTLSSPLKVGAFYCIRLHISVADQSRSGARNLQIIFHTDSTLFIVPFTPVPGGMTQNFQDQLDKLAPITFQSDYLVDTINWIQLEANFKADSAYNFFTLGNFNSLYEDDFIPLRPTDLGSSPLTYFYIDDVSIFDCSDTIPPPEPQYAFEVKAFPNPASDWFQLEYTLPAAGSVRIHITDVFGRLVVDRTVLSGENGENLIELDGSSWASGRYHISVLYEGGGRSEYRHLKQQIMR